MTKMVETGKEPEHTVAPAGFQEPNQLTLEVGPMAHGGHCIARHEDRVVFVRHAIPGEIVVAELTDADPASPLWFADTRKVLEASEFRRSHPWKLADSQRAYASGRTPVAGAEYGHIILEHQRRVKAQVFRDMLSRLGDQVLKDVEVHVQGLDDDYPAGRGWRTRNVFAISSSGKVRLHAHRSPESYAVRNIPLAFAKVDKLQLWKLNFSGASRIEVTTPGHGQEALITIVPTPEVAASQDSLAAYIQQWEQELARLPQHVAVQVAVPPKRRRRRATFTQIRGRSWVEEQVETPEFGAKSFRVSSDVAWPLHQGAPALLTEAMLQAADVQPGQTIADLYAGSGLFSRYLADAVGDDGTVLSVDPNISACEDARINLDGTPQAFVVNAPVRRVLASWLEAPEAALAEGGLDGKQLDIVVLRPPRSGAKKAVVGRVNNLNPNKIVYVSCDPASLARDTRRFNDHGWQLDTVEVYDLHPNTHQIDAVCVFTRK